MYPARLIREPRHHLAAGNRINVNLLTGPGRRAVTSPANGPVHDAHEIPAAPRQVLARNIQARRSRHAEAPSLRGSREPGSAADLLADTGTPTTTPPPHGPRQV
jgi:hypothetical protein